MAAPQSSLPDALIQRGLLKPEILARYEARAAQENKTLVKILQEEKAIFPEALAQLRAELLDVPYIDLEKVKLNENAMRDISRKAAATYQFIAFEERDKSLLVAMESPDDFQALEAVKFIAKKRGLSAEIYIASHETIDKALGGAAQVQAEIGGAIKEFSQELEDAKKVQGKDTKDIERIMEEAPVTKVVAVIIRHAIEGHASDIHIEPTEKELRVRYRIDGVLHTSLSLPLKVQAATISRIKILSNLKIDETRLPQDGRFSARVDDKPFDVRVSTMPTTYGEKVALRILDKSSRAPSFEELGLRGEPEKIFQEYLKAPHGIILISGPTGSGKSTTLFASLNIVNVPGVNVVTLEDPVEYEVVGVNQTQVHPEIGLTFASGLRSILRQDPDIVMVGEIRDKDTAALAIHASLTGHLVLSTIHTNDAIGTVPRLIDMGIDPFLLAASLRLLAAQRLVGRICQQCKKAVPLSAALKEKITEELSGVPEAFKTDPNQRKPEVLYESPGCPACQEGQAVGRLAIFEVVPVTRALRAAMNEGADYDTLKAVAQRDHALTMHQDGLLKALAGEVLYEDVVRVTSEAQETNF
jgi:type IV pilus assembly protein PilB